MAMSLSCASASFRPRRKTGAPDWRVPQRLAAAAEAEIGVGDDEAVLGVAQDQQPLAGGEAQPLVIEQHAVGGLAAAPDPAAQLVQLRQAEAVGVLDHHDGRLRHVDADLDHRGGDQEAGAAGGEVAERRVRAAPGPAGHAPGRPGRAEALRPVRRSGSRRRRCRWSRFPATWRADPEDAGAAVQRPGDAGDHLRQAGACRAGVVAMGWRPAGFSVRRLTAISPHWVSSRVRGMGVAVITSMSERAGSASSRPSPLPASSRRWATPKRCCSSTTARPRSRKRDAFLEQGVGADGDVDRALGQAGQHAAALGALHAAGQQFDPHAGREAERRQGAEVLAREHLGRRHQRGLGAGLDRPEHGQRGDQGLAGADIALQQPEHAVRRGHVGVDLGQRLCLAAGERMAEGGERPFPQAVVADAGCGRAAPAVRRRTRARAICSASTSS